MQLPDEQIRGSKPETKKIMVVCPAKAYVFLHFFLREKRCKQNLNFPMNWCNFSPVIKYQKLNKVTSKLLGDELGIRGMCILQGGKIAKNVPGEMA